MTDSTLKNIEFKTSSATGSTQRSSTGQALSNLIIGSLESANQLANGIYTQKQRDLAEQNRIKSENEQQDYLLVLDAKNKIQQKSRELVDSKANAEVYSNELSAYIDSVSNIEFATEEKKLQYGTFANALKEDAIDKKNIYIEDLAIDKATNLLRENINHIDDIEEFYNNTLKGSLYKKNDVEVKTFLYDTYGKSIGTYIQENQDSIIDTLVKKGKQGKNLSQSYINSMYPALSKVGNPTIRKTIEGYTNKLDKVINTKIHYNNVVSVIDKAVDKGDVATLNALRYSQDKETRSITKDMVEVELNNVDLNDKEQLSNALKISSIYGVKIDKIENTMASLVNGNITEEQLPEAIGLWNRVKLAGYTPSKDIGDKFDEINAIKSLYSNSGMDEATQWKQSYTTYKEGKKNTKLDVKTINSALESSNAFFGSTPVEGFKEASNSQYESLLVDKVRNVMQYVSAQDTSTIQRIAKEIDKDMRANSVKVGDKLVPNLGMFGTDEKGKNISQVIVDTYIDSLKEQKYENIDIEYLNTSTTKGNQFIVTYSDNIKGEQKRIATLDDIRKDADKHYKYLKSVDSNKTKEDSKTIESLKESNKAISESIREIAQGTFNWRDNLKIEEQMEGIASVGNAIQKIKDFYTGEFLEQFNDTKKDEKIFQLSYDNKISDNELKEMFGLDGLEQIYNSVGTKQGYDLIDENKGALKGGITDDALATLLGKKAFDIVLPTIIKSKQAVFEFFKSTKDVKMTSELNKEIADAMSSHMVNVLTKVNTGEGVAGILAKQEKNLQRMNEKIKLDKFNKDMEKEQSLINLERKIQEIQQVKYNEKVIDIKKEIDNFTGKANSTLGDFNKAKEELEIYSTFKKNWKQITEDKDTFEAFEKMYGNRIGLDLKDSMATNMNKLSEWSLRMDSRLINKKPEEIDGWLDIINKADLKAIFK